MNELQTLKERTDSPMWAEVLECARREGANTAGRRHGIGVASVIRVGAAHGLTLHYTKRDTVAAAHTAHAERMRDHYNRTIFGGNQ